MAHTNGSPDTLEKHQREVCSAFARAAVAMRDAANTAENFSVWFSRVNNLENVSVPPVFNALYNFNSQFGGGGGDPRPPQQQSHQGSDLEQTGKKRKAPGDQEGKKKRPTKEKKPHDPNAPKRPPSAYLLFQNDVRKTVKGQHPDMPYGQVLGEISKLWHALTPEERAPYMQATADSKIVYEKAKANYDANSPAEARDAKDMKDASTKVPASKNKAAAAAMTTEDKPVAKDTTSDDDDSDNEDDSTSSSSSDKSSNAGDNDEEDEEVELVPEPVPEPPRKKSKKEAVKPPSPMVKVDKKKKNEEGKKKK